MRASQREKCNESGREPEGGDLRRAPWRRLGIAIWRRGPWRRDDGQSAVVVVAVAAALLVVFLTALVTMGATAIDRTRAQTAADAAALASVGGGRSEAVSLAAAHGATVVSWRRESGAGEVTVTVRIGDVTASARATDAP